MACIIPETDPSIKPNIDARINFRAGENVTGRAKYMVIKLAKIVSPIVRISPDVTNCPENRCRNNG